MQFTTILALALTAVFVGTCDAQWNRNRRRGGGVLGHAIGGIQRAFSQAPCCLTAIPDRCLPEFVYGDRSQYPRGCPSNLVSNVWTFDRRQNRCQQRGILRNVFNGVFDGMNLYNSRDLCNTRCIDPSMSRGRFNDGYGQRFDQFGDNFGDNYINREDRFMGRQQFQGMRPQFQNRGRNGFQSRRQWD